MSFTDRLQQRAAEVQNALDTALANAVEMPLTDALRYAVTGGKGVRGFLVMEAAALFDVPPERSVRAAAAIEAVHAYSLVHDDLPCMDDDDMRRGQPTVHIKWDEATAVLVGDALQSLAFELVADPATHPEGEVRAVLTLTLAQAAAAMVVGQAQDIAAGAAGRPLTLDEITALQANKTGALIRWSAEAGAHLGRADPTPLRAYATALGLAFQIADDILDVEGDAEKAGKRLQKDSDAGKATFVSHLGLDGAKTRARTLVAEAEAALAPFGSEAEHLREAARFVISRDF